MTTWLRAIGVAVPTAIAGTVLGAFAGDVGARLHGVSDFEGGRGFLVVFGLAPLAGLCSFLIGLAAGKPGPWRGGAAYVTRVSVAVAASALLVAMATALAWGTARRVPMIAGELLDLAVEIRLAAGTPAPQTAKDLRVALQSTAGDNAYADIDWDRIDAVGQGVVVPARGELASVAGQWQVVVDPGDTALSQVFVLPLPGEPTLADEAWSAWQPPTRGWTGAAVEPARAAAVRYRVERRMDE